MPSRTPQKATSVKACSAIAQCFFSAYKSGAPHLSRSQPITGIEGAAHAQRQR